MRDAGSLRPLPLAGEGGVVMAAASLSMDQTVDIRAESGRIVIEPVREPVHDLDELLDQITPETLHDEVDFGPPVGKKIW